MSGVADDKKIEDIGPDGHEEPENTKDDDKPQGWLAEMKEFFKAIGWAFAIALVLRSFVIEAYKIPSGSMLPTLSIGDHIFVNKFVYGLMIPGTTTKIGMFNKPQRGDVIVFKFPDDISKDYIKRVVGLPGDVISVHGEDLYVNGELQQSDPKGMVPIVDQGCDPVESELLTEHLVVDPKTHKQVDHAVIHMNGRGGGFAQTEWTVPEGRLFAMGDNRDNSADSRTGWTVPYSYVKGRAMFIWLSWNGCGTWWPFTKIRFDRFGQGVQ